MKTKELTPELLAELEREAKNKYPTEMFFDVIANGYVDINAGKRGAWKGGAKSEIAAKIHTQGMIPSDTIQVKITKSAPLLDFKGRERQKWWNNLIGEVFECTYNKSGVFSLTVNGNKKLASLIGGKTHHAIIPLNYCEIISPRFISIEEHERQMKEFGRFYKNHGTGLSLTESLLAFKSQQTTK